MTLQQAQELLFEIEIYFNDAVYDALQESAQVLDENMSNRIFKKGLNAAGTKIGKYGRYYSKVYDSLWVPLRKSRGLQVEYVDLNFTGELKSSLVVEKQDDTVVYGFDDEQVYEKALFQETLQGEKVGIEEMDIFSVTTKEENIAIKEIQRKIERDLNSIIDSF